MTEADRLAKNARIKSSLYETKAKRAEQVCRTFTVKIQRNKLSKRKQECLHMMFVEGKWLYNAVLNHYNNGGDLSKYDTKSNTVMHYDRDNKPVISEMNHISSQMKQSIVAFISQNLRGLRKRKMNGSNVGSLRYKTELNTIRLKQYGMTYKILGNNRIQIQGLGSVKVTGLEQFANIENLEFASADLIRRSDGLFIRITTYINKDQIEHKTTNGKTIGVDFGCRTSFTTSEGDKVKASVAESEHLKTLQRKIARQVKGSNNWWKTKAQIARNYQLISNRKTDIANKFVAVLTEYDRIVIQDENLKGWHKSKFKLSGTVQHSILGRVKTRLKANDRVIVLDRYMPTTKFCRECGCINGSLTLSDRVFRCPCGAEEDRDIHAALNMVWMYQNNYQYVRKHKTASIETVPEVRSEKKETTPVVDAGRIDIKPVNPHSSGNKVHASVSKTGSKRRRQTRI